MKNGDTIKASTIYEVLIAMLIFMSVVFVSFYMLYVLNSNYERNNYLKFENLIEQYKHHNEQANVMDWNVEEEIKVYPLSTKVLWKQYKVLANTGEVLFVKNELVLIEN
jgi:hypothetical protein